MALVTEAQCLEVSQSHAGTFVIIDSILRSLTERIVLRSTQFRTGPLSGAVALAGRIGSVSRSCGVLPLWVSRNLNDFAMLT